MTNLDNGRAVIELDNVVDCVLEVALTVVGCDLPDGVEGFGYIVPIRASGHPEEGLDRFMAGLGLAVEPNKPTAIRQPDRGGFPQSSTWYGLVDTYLPERFD